MRSQCIGASTFARLLNISERKARQALARCYRGQPYKGMNLKVVVRHGRGGKGGVQYRVLVASLPPELQRRAVELGFVQAGALEPVTTAPVPVPMPNNAVELNGGDERKYALIRPALQHPKGSTARANAVRATAAGIKESTTTLRNWIRAYEGDPINGLVRKPPKNKGQKRVHIGRRWHREMSAAGLSKDQLISVERELDQLAKDLWAAHGDGGGCQVQIDASQDLYRLSRDAGIALPEAELRALCQVPRGFVYDWDRRKYAKVHTARTDAKEFADSMPDLRRPPEYWGKPLDCLCGDCTPLDIRFLRPDGSDWKITLIGWEDLRTHRFFGNLYARPKSGGVKQSHVALSAACVISNVGVPNTVLIDNGPEYGCLKNGNGLFSVMRALPYSARSKPIEAVFRVIQRYLRRIKGYIGSDRMNKKTQTVGRPTEPFPGTFMELVAEVEKVIEFYNARPQRVLHGRSPNDVWNGYVADGWSPRVCDMETLMEGTAKKLRSKVTKGHVTIDNKRWTSHELLTSWALDKQWVTINKPFVDEFPPSLYDPKGRFVCLLHPDDDYPTAEKSGRMKSLRRAGLREMSDQVRPVNLQAYTEQFLEFQPPAQAPKKAQQLLLSGPEGQAIPARRRDASPASRKAEAKRREAERAEAEELFHKGLQAYRERQRKDAFG